MTETPLRVLIVDQNVTRGLPSSRTACARPAIAEVVVRDMQNLMRRIVERIRT